MSSRERFDRDGKSLIETTAASVFDDQILDHAGLQWHRVAKTVSSLKQDTARPEWATSCIYI